MNINKYIFREYDIRGKVEDDFPPEVVENLGKAFGTFIKRAGGQEVALSGDVRLTTPQLIESFKTGVLSTGTDVINIGILPIFMGFTMWLQQKLNPAPADPTQARIFALLPFVFTFVLAGFAAGLVLYWSVNNILSIAQQWYIQRRILAKNG